MLHFLRRFGFAHFLHYTPRVIHNVLADSLTFLDRNALHELYLGVQKCEREGLKGVLIEAGCAAGGSAIVMAAAKRQARQLFVHDVFGMIPSPSENDGSDVWRRYNEINEGVANGIGDRNYYGYEPDLFSKVEFNFSKHGCPIHKNNVMLIKGLFQNTINGSQPVALAHLDGDWYDSVMVCLQRIAPRLVPGGTLVIDDYDSWSGCKKAVDEYFADKGQNFIFQKKSRLHIVRN